MPELNKVNHWDDQTVVKPLWKESCIYALKLLSNLKQLKILLNPTFYKKSAHFLTGLNSANGLHRNLLF